MKTSADSVGAQQHVQHALRKVPFLFSAVRAVYRFFYPFIGICKRQVALLYCTLEYSLLLLLRLSLLRSAEHLYPFRCVSFGHQTLDLYMLSLRFPSKSVVVLYSDYGNVNHYIADSFPDVTVSYLSHSRLYACCVRNTEYTMLKKRMGALVWFFSRLAGSKANVLWDCNERDSDVQIEGRYMIELINLIASHPTAVARAPESLLSAFAPVFSKTCAASEGRWFVALYLRQKRAGGVMDVRDTTPEPYRALIERITGLGGAVFCGGDYDPHVLFPGMAHVYGHRDFSCSSRMTDAYFLSQSRLFIGTHSGPLIVSTAYGIPCLITNCAFYYLSGYRPNHRVLFKRLRDVESGRVLRAAETFAEPIVSYVHDRKNGFALAGYEHIDNTADELVAAFDDIYEEVLTGTYVPTEEDMERTKKFRSLLPPRAVASVSPCVPCKSYLQDLLW